MLPAPRFIPLNIIKQAVYKIKENYEHIEK